jgi:hypothetical protein
MDIGKLNSNERLAVYGAVGVIAGYIISGAGYFGFGLYSLVLIAAVAMLVVVFLPQLSPTTTLPGSRGSLMVLCGAVAALIMLMGTFGVLGVFGGLLLTFSGLFFLIELAGALAMGWAGWRELQGEGGVLRIGSARAPDAPAAQEQQEPDREDGPPA